ncbi:MAG TPA: hypothetical protein VFQ00_01650 [Terriglobales bacterium]|nr:hypothetical protein [Terriglobales bacterium]
MQLGEIAAERFASVPVLSTVLRVDLKIPKQGRESALNVVQTWVDQKRPSLQPDWTKKSSVLRDVAGGYQCSFADDDENFALSFEHPDTQISERTWLVDVTLELRDGQLYFATRLSVRQPKITGIPAPRAPRILGELIKTVEVFDGAILQSQSRVYEASDLDEFLQLLTSPERSLPLLAISIEDSTNAQFVDASRLASLLGGVAHVALLSPEACWGLTHRVGKGFSVYLGAVRCYGAHFSTTDDPKRHRLWLAEMLLRMSGDKDRFINQCLSYTFAQVTSTFESFPLQNPRAIKSRVQATAPRAEVSLVPIMHPVPDVAEPTELRLNEQTQLAEQRTRELQGMVEKLEAELQEIRSQNAEIVKKFEEEQSTRQLFEDDNQLLNRQIAILQGGNLDQNQPGAIFLKALGEAAMAAQIFLEEYKQVHHTASMSESLQTEIEILREENFDLKSRISSLENHSAVSANVQHESLIVVGDTTSLEAFFREKYPENIEITNKAKKSFRSYAYTDGERLNAGLRVLRDSYLPMKLSERDNERKRFHQDFTESLTTLRFTYGKTATEVGRGMAPSDHSLKIGTRTLDLYKIRDITSDFNWQYFFCVYFAWDEERRKLVLNGFGHGDSPSSHT